MKNSNSGYASATVDAGGNNREAAKKILVAVSASSVSQEALITGLALARQSGGRLVVLQAVELNIPGEERGVPRGELLRELMVAAESRLLELARSICRDVRFSVVVTEGPPSEAIARVARRCNADAIVLGPRRSSPLSWLRRNTVRAVLRDAERPVYLVAPQENLPATPLTGRGLWRWPATSPARADQTRPADLLSSRAAMR